MTTLHDEYIKILTEYRELLWKTLEDQGHHTATLFKYVTLQKEHLTLLNKHTELLNEKAAYLKEYSKGEVNDD